MIHTICVITTAKVICFIRIILNNSSGAEIFSIQADSDHIYTSFQAIHFKRKTTRISHDTALNLSPLLR